MEYQWRRCKTKTHCDTHGRPIPRDLFCQWCDCDPIPVVVLPVDVSTAVRIQSVSEFEKRYGDSLRRTYQYHALGYKALGSALAKRTALHLSSDGPQWVADPILVSQKVLQTWCEMYTIPTGRDIVLESLRGQPMATSTALEECVGTDLRWRISLGLTGYKSCQALAAQYDIRVTQHVVRQWYDTFRKHTPLQSSRYRDDDGLQLPVSVVSQADLRDLESTLRIWHHVEGRSIYSILSLLQERCEEICEDMERGIIEHVGSVFFKLLQHKKVTYTVLHQFYRDHLRYEISHWQHLLQEPFAGYLKRLKADANAAEPQYFPEGVGRLNTDDGNHQRFFKEALWQKFAVSCAFRTAELHNVWQYVCELSDPSDVVLPCSECGYVFPCSKVVVQPYKGICMGELDVHNLLEHSQAMKRVSAHSFVCDLCVADAKLCRLACLTSLKTKWRRSRVDHEYWMARGVKQSGHLALDRSVAALYERREAARQSDCARRVNWFADPGVPEWQIHDELLWRYGYDVPLPRFYQNVEREKWLRLLGSDLTDTDRITPASWARVVQERSQHIQRRQSKRRRLGV